MPSYEGHTFLESLCQTGIKTQKGAAF